VSHGARDKHDDSRSPDTVAQSGVIPWLKEEQMLVQFDEELQVLVDQGGIMLPPSEVEALLEQITIHKQHSAQELESIGRRSVVERYRGMEHQFNYDWFK
jgi:hypothetical protein